ncbi:transmembrane channel-like protein 1 [Rhipicephalus microplus]|uniref:transmembrane channel-like protein 1 n=1 Tax=Rhipicephalus microplus TaxID=6941 RepID=UPI003F6B832A
MATTSITEDMGEEDMYLEMYLRHKGAERRQSRRFSRQSSSRRGSSPFPWETAAGRRRLSSYTLSSDFGSEFAIDVDDLDQTEEEVKDNVRMNKSIIETCKNQPWPMNKKYKMLRRAKAYVKKHEGELAQSKQARDVLAKYTILLNNSWHRLQREVAELVVTLTPWEMRIKRIESHFGSVVASYFIFLRWVFWLNIFIAVFVSCFLMIPEVLRGDDDPSGMRKQLESEEMKSALNLQAIWEFEGYLKYSPIFYGYYSDREMTEEGYRLPLAYLLSSLTMYIFSFFVILRKMAENSRQSKMTEKADECTFTWKLFSGWDFMIGNSETAHNKVASLVMSFKEAILEEKERKKEERSWKIMFLRALANFIVLVLLASSAYAVVLVVERSQEPEAEKTWYRQNEVTLVVSMISIVYPNLFDLIGLMEQYHPRIQLRWQLARILILYLLNLYTLIFALFGKVMSMTTALVGMKENITYLLDMGLLEPSILNTTSLDSNATTFVPSTVAEDMILSTTTMEPFIASLAEALVGQSFGQAASEPFTPNSNCTIVPVNCTLLFQLGVNLTRAGILPFLQSDNLVVTNGTYLEEIVTTLLPFLNETAPTTPQTDEPTTTQVPPTRLFEGYDAILLRIANFTVIGVANWTYRFPSSPDGNISMPVIYVDNYSKTVNVTDEEISPVPNKWPPLWKGTMGTPRDANDTTVPTWTEFATTLDPNNCTVVYVSVCNGVTDGPFEIPSWTSSETTRTTSTTTEPSTRKPGSPLRPEDLLKVDEQTKEKLRKLCWETMFGQEIVKITVMDLVMTIASTIITDFIRALIVRYANDCWCWDLEQGFPGYGDFKIAENILHLVNNQGMVWMGMYFSVGLPAINTVKLCIMMYVRSWAVLTCNIPHETVFKASGSNNFYFMLLLIMLFVCTLPVGYAMVWLEPSWHCGPFSGYFRAYRVFTGYLDNTLPSWMNKIIEYLTSPGVVVPLILLLILIIYYLVALTGSLRESNNDLKLQLRREKDTETKSEKNEKKEETATTLPAPITTVTVTEMVPPEPDVVVPKVESSIERTAEILNKWNTARRMTSTFPSKLKAAALLSAAADRERGSDSPTKKPSGSDTPSSDARGRKVQYNLQNSDEAPLVDGQSLDAPSGTRTPQAERKKQSSPRTPKPLLKSIEKLRLGDTQTFKKRKESEEKDEEREGSRSVTEGGDSDDRCPRETLPLLDVALPYPVVPRPALVRELSRHYAEPHVPRVNVCPPTPLHTDHEERKTHVERQDTDSL